MARWFSCSLLMLSVLTGCDSLTPLDGTLGKDSDHDGVPDRKDCAPDDPDKSPGAPERCNAEDDDCDASVDEDLAQVAVYTDSDGDGFGLTNQPAEACGALPGLAVHFGDCDDAQSLVYPGATEVCNNLDDNCNGQTDEASAADASLWYGDVDGDGWGGSTYTAVACDAPSGFVATGGDCDDGNGNIHPEADEICDGRDQDCDGATDDDPVDGQIYYADADADGHGDPATGDRACQLPDGQVDIGDDCDDSDAGIRPGLPDACDGADNDCDGATDEDGPTPWYPDHDGDGYGAGGPTYGCGQPPLHAAVAGDCDDEDDGAHPGGTETCDTADDDCDGRIDEDAVDPHSWHADTDHDGYGAAGIAATSCQAPVGAVEDASDCDDHDASAHPGAAESCDLTDDDCDGQTDEDAIDPATFYTDGDGDGWGTTPTVTACEPPDGYTSQAGDCDDGASGINPGATDACDEADNDCDGAVDEQGPTPWYLDGDGDGWGAGASVQACGAPEGRVAKNGDCDDADGSVHPTAAETCDSDDEDCDSRIDEEASGGQTYHPDSDQDGYGDGDIDLTACTPPSGAVVNGTDCDDQRSGTHPGASEHCDLADEDCDNRIDEGAVDKDSFYADLDDDGYGGDTQVQACQEAPGQTPQTGDCDDGDEDVHPGAPDVCDGADNDCDAQTDEDGPITWYTDADADGYGDDGTAVEDCAVVPDAVTTPGDCDDLDPDINPGVTDTCGDSIDSDCNGSTGGQIWRVPVVVHEQSGDDQTDLQVALTITEEPVLAHILAAPGSLRVYGSPTSTPYASPYTGIPLHLVTASGSATLQLKLDLAAGEARTLWLYYGLSDVPSVSDINSVYIFADDFDHGLSGWTTRSGTTGTPSTTVSSEFYRSPPSSLRTSLLGSGSCVSGNFFAYSVHSFNAEQAGSYLIETSGFNSNCSSCSVYTSVTTDAGVVGETYSTGWVTIKNTHKLTAGTHTLNLGLRAGTLCGGLYAHFDDLRISRMINHPPWSEVQWWEEVDDCGTRSCPLAVDGVLASFYVDGDGDGFGDGTKPIVEACTRPAGHTDIAGDCDDANATVYPGATERCDGLDHDCDGLVWLEGDPVPTWYPDADGDGYGTATGAQSKCGGPTGYIRQGGDCNDGAAGVHPDQADTCDGIDTDCDGEADEDGKKVWYPDVDNDGYGASSPILSCLQPPGSSTMGSDCDDHDDQVSPAAVETCGDGEDANCDGHDGDDILELPIWVTEQSSFDQVDLPIEVVITDPDVVDRLAPNPGAARIYPWPVTNPFAEPYVGQPYALAIEDGIAHLWFLADLPAQKTTTWSMYLGPAGTPDGRDPDAVFDAFFNFSTLDDGWTAPAAYTLALDSTVRHSGPTSLKTTLTPDTQCQPKVVSANRTVDVARRGWHRLSWYAASATPPTCSGCAITTQVGLNGKAYNTTSTTMIPLDEDVFLQEGPATLSLGTSINFCGVPASGWIDDLRLIAFTSPEPAVEVRVGELRDTCGILTCASGSKATWYSDVDGDGYGDGRHPREACSRPPNHSATGGDCDLDDPNVRPGAPERCNAADDDCDGRVDEAVADPPISYPDVDGDGFGDPLGGLVGCPATGATLAGGDCDDGDGGAFPGAPEDCLNSVDDDCDGFVDNCTVLASTTSVSTCPIRITPQGAGLTGGNLDYSGDLDGDGYDDILITDSGGGVYLFFGPLRSGTWSGTQASIGIVVGSEGFTASQIGTVHTTDFNGDGYLDVGLSTGAPYTDPEGRAIKGSIFVFFGPINRPLGGWAEWKVADADLRIAGTPGWELASFVPGGDLSGDGVDDILVAALGGASQESPVGMMVEGPLTAGRVDLEDVTSLALRHPIDGFGVGWVVPSGDLNADGVGDIVVGGNITRIFFGGRQGVWYTEEADIQLTGLGTNPASSSDSFGSTVMGPGDINGDGYDDLLVGAPRDDTAATDAGAVHIFYGPLLEDRDLDSDPADVKILGHGSGEKLGTYVASAGDFDVDGYADLLLGSSRSSGFPGYTSLFLGRPLRPGTTVPNGSLDAKLSDASQQQGVYRVGDVNGDGRKDASVWLQSGSTYVTMFCTGQ